MGKGHWRRPSDVDHDTFRSNWERIFNNTPIGAQTPCGPKLSECACKGDYATASGVCPTCGDDADTT